MEITETPNPVVARTGFYANMWEIREYADGMYDAAHRTGPALSPGFDSFDQACGWVCDQMRDATQD
jgi:hypothetical protein